MKIAVISDLHIGHSQETHQLGHSDHDFAYFLFNLEKEYDKIILLGDIYEIEMEPILKDEDTYKISKKQHNVITKRFNKDKYIYVFGNHDLVGEKFGGIERYEFYFKDKKYLFIHGHQFDHWCKTPSAHLATLGGLCLKFNLKHLYKWVTEHSSFGNFSIKNENKKFENKAIFFAKKNEYDFIITGHTHEPKVLLDKVSFLNSGTCTYGRTCFLHMDLENDIYEVRSEL